jgi:hypothetical protein
LKILAALIWHIGGVVLVIKGGSLLMEAAAIKPDKPWPWAAAVMAVLIGGIKAKYLFNRSCRKNLFRIAALDPPRIWQFFSPVFLVSLILMILAGATLSRISHGNYPLLLCIATLDLAIATALIGSSYVFWKKNSAYHQDDLPR